ncbi:hypothetical protein ACN27B_08810 [Micromonospora sp. WMMD754]|uniref:hypothetical protein n=1 Tax=Micromonospora sp. WMMD754 TaxID=3404114 RepID=UPI003BF4F6A6
MTGLVIGMLVGAALAWPVGKAYARAQRAYRDLMATKKAIKGLFRRVVEQWAIVLKLAAGFGLLFALVFTAGVWMAVR